MTSKIKMLDLFAGCGGLAEGFLETQKYETVAAVEWEKAPVETLRKRLLEKWEVTDAEKRVLHFDIQNEKELFSGWTNNKEYDCHAGLDTLVQDSNGIDIVIGGPPCQAYSVAGRVRDIDGMHNDYRNYLFEHYLSVVNRYQPKIFVFENVPGILSSKPGGTSVTEAIRNGFNSIGYEIVDDLRKYSLLDASEYGVPQTRKRVVIVGINKKYYKNKDRQKLLKAFYCNTLPKYKEKGLTVKETIGDLPAFKPSKDPLKHKSRDVYSMVNKTEQNVSWHEARYHNLRDMDIFNILAEDIMIGTNKYTNSKALSELYHERVGSYSPIHRYHVLRPDRPSTTIIAHLYKDGNRFIHYDPEQSRSITPREAARLQSFPDNYEFCGARGAVYKMIGNAVPPKLAQKIANALLDDLLTL